MKKKFCLNILYFCIFLACDPKEFYFLDFLLAVFPCGGLDDFTKLGPDYEGLAELHTLSKRKQKMLVVSTCMHLMTIRLFHTTEFI